MDKAVTRNGVVCYGAIGVGGTKMKIHTAALRQLFESNDRVLDTNAIYEIGMGLG
jgi:methylenetetrahydrofolate/methylenetetrahydromethanopterin dehydrogenase (NADP+)